MTILRAGDLAPPDLLRLLQELTPPAGVKVRCWLDAPDGWALDYWLGPTGSCAGTAPAGTRATSR